MTAPSISTAGALAVYDAALTGGVSDWRDIADGLAAALRRATPAPRAPKAKPATGFRMTAESVARALKIVCRAIEKRVSVPILAHALLTARGDVLTICGTDLDREIYVDIAAPGIGEWSATVDAYALAAMLAKASGPVTFIEGEPFQRKFRLPDARGAMIERGETCSTLIVTGAINIEMPGLPVADFPIMRAPPGRAETLPLSAEQLVDGLSFVRLAISTEETRYYLTGAFIHAEERAGETLIKLVATDGHRMNVIEFPAPGSKPDCLTFPQFTRTGEPSIKAAWGAIVPMRACADFLFIIPMFGAQAVTVWINRVKLNAGPVTVIAKLIDGSFPDYRRVVPDIAEARTTTLESTAFLAAIAQAASVSDDKRPCVTLSFDGAAGLEITGRNMEGRELKARATYAGDAEALKVGLNSGYLRDAITSLASPDVTMAFSGVSPLDPVLVAAPGKPDRLTAVMPTRP